MTQADWPDAFTPDVAKALAEPFAPDVIKWRPGPKTKTEPVKARALAYVDARDVMDRLDAVVGPAHWNDYYTVVDEPSGAVKATIKIFGVYHEDVGYPNAAGDDEGLKGAFSDAFKRAAVKFGVGRPLYDMPQFWIPLVGQKPFEKLEFVPVFQNGRWSLPSGGGAAEAAKKVFGEDIAKVGGAEVADETLRRRMFAAFKTAGLDPAHGLVFAGLALGRRIHTTKGFTVEEVNTILGKITDPRLVNAAQSEEVSA